MGSNFLKEYEEYKKADEEYTKVSNQYETSEDEIVLSDEDKEIIKKEKKEYIFPVNQNRADFPAKNVNFFELKKTNPDTVAWIYSEQLFLDYPVVKTDNNQKYLNTTFEGMKNASGCIFMDHQCPSDFTDYNTFIYGHQMKNGSMFGSLKKIIKEKENLATPHYFYIFTTTGILRYKMVSCYVTNNSSPTYDFADNDLELRDYVNYIYRNSVFSSTIAQGDIKHLVTLSTCHGPHGTSQRFVVHGALIDKYYYAYDNSGEEKE